MAEWDTREESDARMYCWILSNFPEDTRVNAPVRAAEKDLSAMKIVQMMEKLLWVHVSFIPKRVRSK